MSTWEWIACEFATYFLFVFEEWRNAYEQTGMINVLTDKPHVINFSVAVSFAELAKSAALIKIQLTFYITNEYWNNTPVR